MVKKKIPEKKPTLVVPTPPVAPPDITPAPVRHSQIELLRGFKDIFAPDGRYWEWLLSHARDISRAYGFSWMETPILESTNLFVRAVGKQTDIVEKEMFRFVDQGGDDVVLRPEATASVARAYVNHGLLNQPQPVKVWYWGPMFRHDRPQAGRYREFHQWGCETIGEGKPIVDAELIALAWNFLSELGLQSQVSVNSIGEPAMREAYKEQLTNFYRGERAGLCEDCKRRLQRNPLRLLDCKQEGCRAIRAEAPQLIDALDEESKNHFMRVLEYLDEAGVPYVLDPYLVRGLDYYNRTVFEIVMPNEDEKAQSALGGGGRYDGLIELVGGRPTLAAGFAIGLERVILALKAGNIEPPPEYQAEVFLAQLGEQAKRRAMVLFEECRRAGLRALATFTKDSLKQQLEAAARAGARYTIIIGQKEFLDGTAIIRDMDSGVQEMHDQKKIIAELKRKLETATPLVSVGEVVSPPPIDEVEPALFEDEEKLALQSDEDLAKTEVDDTLTLTPLEAGPLTGLPSPGEGEGKGEGEDVV